MKTFKIRFIADSGFVSDAVRYVTFSEWSHVEIVTETGTYIGAHAGSGVQERPADYCKPNKERRYAIPVSDEAYVQIMDFARKKIGTPYDYKDIVGLFLHHGLKTKGREICSMFVTEAAMAGGVELLNVLPGYTYRITPEDLHLSRSLIGTCYFDSDKR